MAFRAVATSALDPSTPRAMLFLFKGRCQNRAGKPPPDSRGTRAGSGKAGRETESLGGAGSRSGGTGIVGSLWAQPWPRWVEGTRSTSGKPPLQNHQGQGGRAGQTLPRPSLSPRPPFSLSSSLAIHSSAQTTFLNRDLRQSGGSWSLRDSATAEHARGSAGNSDLGSGCQGDALATAPVCQRRLTLRGLPAPPNFHRSCFKASLACSELQGSAQGFPG